MDSKLAYGLARQDLRNNGKVIESYMEAHHRLLVPAAKALGKRPKMSFDEAKSIFSRFKASQEGTPGHVLTQVYCDPGTSPLSKKFDSSVVTIHAVPGKREFDDKDEEVLELYLMATRVTRQRVSVVQKPMDFTIRHHAMSRYHERLHGRRPKGSPPPNVYRDLAAGVTINLSASLDMQMPLKPMVVPTTDGAFLGLSFFRPLHPEKDHWGQTITIEHGRIDETERVVRADPWVTEFWINTYLHENDMTEEQRALVATLREVESEVSRSMLLWASISLFGDQVEECMPALLAPKDKPAGDILANWMAEIREAEGWGSMMRTVRDGRFRPLAEKVERWMTDDLPRKRQELERLNQLDRITKAIKGPSKVTDEHEFTFRL